MRSYVVRKWIVILPVLVIVSLILIISLSHKSSAEHSRNRDVTRMNDVAYKSLHYDDLDDVKIPAGIASQVKDYNGFRLSFNKENGTPNWVAWELLGTETSGTEPRSDNFWQDQEIEGCPTTDDYKRSGYDRGHMCPSADQKWSEAAMTDCFVMTNMTPQNHNLNAGAWATLEARERVWAKRDSAIVIVAGPIYEKSDSQHIGVNRVRVPGAFFKAIISPYEDEPKGIAFIYPNMKASGNMADYVVTIDQLEELTGFDLFYALPDSIENEIESKSSFKLWNKR